MFGVTTELMSKGKLATVMRFELGYLHCRPYQLPHVLF